jgi:hypothetical protein
MENKLDYLYPFHLLDEEGYPTDEALKYIRNWSSERIGGELVYGKFFDNTDYTDLLDYIKQIWYYGSDAYNEEDGMFELHTVGWSGNESIISELENTIFWMLKFRAYSTGGHYYFRLNRECGYDWSVVKKESLY